MSTPSDWIENDAPRLDGIVDNPSIRIGSPRDIETTARPAAAGCRLLSPKELEDLYAGSLLCQRVCAYIPGEIIRAGWQVDLANAKKEVQSEFKKRLPQYLRQSKIKQMLYQAMTWSSLYNKGAGILLDVNDGRAPGKPVDIGNIKSVQPLYTLDGSTLSPVRTGSAAGGIDYFHASILQEFAGLEEDDPRRIEAERMERWGLDQIHPDRVLWFDGVPAPPGIQNRYNGAVGRLQLFWNSFQRYESALTALSNQLHRQQTLLLGRQGLTETLAASGDAATRDQLKQQLDTAYSGLHNLGVGLYDLKREKLDILKRDVGSFQGAIKLLKGDLISNSGLTEMALFGTTEVGSGLSGADLRDRMDLAHKVANRAETELRAPLEQFFEYVMAAADGPTRGTADAGWVLSFGDPLILTPQEKGALALQWSQIDATYNTLVPGLAEALVTSRFGGGEWSSNTQLPDPLPKTSPQAAPTQQEADPAIADQLPDISDIDKIAEEFGAQVAPQES